MKMLLDFLKTTLLGGFFVLLPLLLLFLLLNEAFEAVVGLATPIVGLFPKGTFDQVEAPLVLAVVLIVVVSFLFGLVGRLAPARRFGRWIESNTLGRLPLYGVVKSLTSRFASLEDDGRFKPALLRGPNDQRELAFLMEELGDGFATVLLPRAPTPMVGSVKVVPMQQVELLDVSLAGFTDLISRWGVGSKELLGKRGD